MKLRTIIALPSPIIDGLAFQVNQAGPQEPMPGQPAEVLFIPPPEPCSACRSPESWLNWPLACCRGQ